MKRFCVAAAAALAVSGCGTGAMFGERSELIYEPSACVEQRLDVYFDEGQARMTQPAQPSAAPSGLSGVRPRIGTTSSAIAPPTASTTTATTTVRPSAIGKTGRGSAGRPH